MSLISKAVQSYFDDINNVMSKLGRRQEVTQVVFGNPGVYMYIYIYLFITSHLQIYIFKEVRSSFLGREYPRVRKILEDTQTRLQNPNVGSNPEIFTVIGREENVRRAIEQLEELQKKLVR